MNTVAEPIVIETIADLLERLGNVPLDRIRMKPPPGTATVQDVIKALEAPRKRICELVDGVLVEKPMGSEESIYAVAIIQMLGRFLDDQSDISGVLLGEAGTLELLPHLVRIPDISFVSWERVGADEWPKEAAPEIVPELAVEVISPSNTKGEMKRKLRDYFEAGVVEAWLVYPRTQTIEIYSAPDKKRLIPKGGTLQGSAVFPGFTMPLSTLFATTRRRKKR